MEELSEIYEKTLEFDRELEGLSEEYIKILRGVLWGPAAKTAPAESPTSLPSASPQQTKKRAKRLSSLQEGEEPIVQNERQGLSTRASNSQLLVTVAAMEAESLPPTPAPPAPVEQATQLLKEQPTPKEKQMSISLMPPPSAPVAAASVSDTTINEQASFARPQRAAKLKSEKCLKEPKLNQKMRRPSKMDETAVKVKLEHESRQSQLLHSSQSSQSSLSRENSKCSTVSSSKSEQSVVVIENALSLVQLISDDEQLENKNNKKTSVENADKGVRNCRIKVKREKASISSNSEEVPNEAQATFIAPAPTVPMPKVQVKREKSASDMSTVLSTTSSIVAAPATKKAIRKKKEVSHKPIKVERFSDIGKESPIASRTRKTSLERMPSQEQQQQPEDDKRNASIYEDAVDNLPESNAEIAASATVAKNTSKSEMDVAAINETVTISIAKPTNTTMVLGVAPIDATFCANSTQTFATQPGHGTFIMDTQNPNATVTLDKKSATGDATFNVAAITSPQYDARQSDASSKNSMATARDTMQQQDDSLITEDESFECPAPAVIAKNKLQPPKALPSSLSKAAASSKLPPSAKSYKIPTRTNELFNPLVQSPVKKKVEAFENAANAASVEQKRITRQNITKENHMSSLTTPVIGKLHAPALGRFLTPTQASNITPNTKTLVLKKTASSASKVQAFPKSISASNLKCTSSTGALSSKTLSRENSSEDVRKDIYKIADERKKQREQKHLLAAQQREAKERERAERMAKVAKEREEKRLKKHMEAEQKRRELEEIQRKLRHQEESAAATEASKQKAAKNKAIAEQERELLTQMKESSKQKMLPPPPPSSKQLQSKYTFEMLHEDDSTDDEGKTSYKRPTPPTWSLSHVRGKNILMQQHMPSSVIDSLFSVQPMTPDLRQIFPNIDVRHLKRNSSVLWSTPPRYSELPKY